MKLKFIHLNIFMGGLFWDNLVSFLKSEQPDILAMQEVYECADPNAQPRFNTLANLQKVLALPYKAYAPTMRRMSEGKIFLSPAPLWGTAFLSKFPLTQVSTHYLDVPYNDHWIDDGQYETSVPRAMQYATADVGEAALHLFNVHGIWSTHGKDTERRLAMSKMIVEKIQDKHPAILCGDFNVNEGTESMNLIGHTMTDLFRGERVTSFNMKRKPADSGYKDAIVDFVFTSPDVRTLSHKQPNVDASDHLPLVCEFEL